MKINELSLEQIVIGLRVKGHHGRLGTITKIDKDDDNYAWITWDGDTEAYGGFYGNNCEIEVIK